MGLRDKLDEALDGDEIDLDFSTARDAFGKIATGEYNAIVVESTVGESKAKVPKVVVKFAIEDDDERKAKGRTFFRHCPARGDGAGILRDTLTALGVDPGAKLKASSLVGKKAVIVVRDQRDNDEYQEIAKVKPATKGSGKRLS